MTESNVLTPLGEKIFLDRYAVKDAKKSTIVEGDLVIVCTDQETRQREVGTVSARNGTCISVDLLDGTSIKLAVEDVDKPLETNPGQMISRVASGIASVETPEKQDEWDDNFRWLLEDWKFVPGGRILTGAGTEQELTYFNCFVLPCPHDSRSGIITTLAQMTEIMSRGGGVGINISSLRPHHAYVKGVNGRSSGSVSWGGLYSFVTGLIEQGGCLTPDTLVSTESGLLRLDEIVTSKKHGWTEQNLIVMTDEGPKLSRKAFNNGVAEVLRVNTDRGLQITGTPNHKLKVMTPTGPEWRRIDRLQSGDAIMVKLGQHKGEEQVLIKSSYQHFNQVKVDLPGILDEELAFFLGYFAGDGFMTVKDGDWRLGVAVAHSSYLVDEMPLLLQRLFPGVNIQTQQKKNDKSLIYLISNRAVKEFLQINGFNKEKSDMVSIPRLIRQSKPEVVGAFLMGLFEADGSVSHGYPSLHSTSRQLIDEVTALLIGLGCPVNIHTKLATKNRYGDKPIWQLRVHSFRGLESWRSHTLCDPQSRFMACLNFEPDKTKEISYKLPHPEYWLNPVLEGIIQPQPRPETVGQRFKATDQPLRRKVMRYTRGERNLTLSAYDTLSKDHPEFARFVKPVNDTWFVFVDDVVSADQSLTLDMEVDDNYTYLANGMVTHNSRRGALILILSVTHPDVLEFINSKRTAGRITNANISVAITDDFMKAVINDDDWPLVFPDINDPDYDTFWTGDLSVWRSVGKPVVTHKTIRARELWDSIIESAWASAEPGLWFVDRAKAMSNSYYYPEGNLISTNPCGEQSLAQWSICNLGSLNLPTFWDGDEVNWDRLDKVVRYAVRFLDNVIDATPYFFDETVKQQKSERRIGLGTMGLAELLIRLKIRYGSPESLKFIDRLYKEIAMSAYLASADIATEKGSFPKFDSKKFLNSGFMQKMPQLVKSTIHTKGLRNVTLLTQAPTGTTGTMIGTSTGIEPYFAWVYTRKSRLGVHQETVSVVEEWQKANPAGQPLPDYFVSAMDLAPEDHIAVQAAIQKWVDSSISKTCNVPADYTVDQIRSLYELMYDLGCKGGTIYRDNSRDEQVLNLEDTNGPTSETKVRDVKLTGCTYRKKTPVGTAYITINDNGSAGTPFEVFITVSKTGSDVAADAEGMGRLISLTLRQPGPLNPVERARNIIGQLRGIGSGRPQGFGPHRVMSLADAVAQAIAEHIGIVATSTLPGLPDMEAAKRDLCPECGQATFVFEESCKKCYGCGYSEC